MTFMPVIACVVNALFTLTVYHIFISFSRMIQKTSKMAS